MSTTGILPKFEMNEFLQQVLANMAEGMDRPGTYESNLPLSGHIVTSISPVPGNPAV